MQERSKGLPQHLAAARAGMSERTARKYEQAGQLPSQLKYRHDWQICANRQPCYLHAVCAFTRASSSVPIPLSIASDRDSRVLPLKKQSFQDILLI